VEQFWDDLRAAMAVPNPEYFMGTFVLTAGTESRATIIDGQQRLGTTALLLACFRDYLAEVKDTNRAATIETDYLASRDLRSGDIETRLLMNRDDREFFAQFLTSDSTVMSPQTESNVRILEAYGFLRAKVREEIRTAGPNWTNRLFQWVDFLESRVQVIVVRVNNDADAFLIFETLNDRGLALTIADLLKNYLFGLAGELIDELEASWVRMIASFDAPADEEVVTTFLRHYWSSFHGATRERDLYRRIRADIRSQNQAFDLVADLEISSTNYSALLSSQHEKWVELGIPKDEVETLLRFGLEQNRPLLLAAMQEMSPSELQTLVSSVISWSVRGLIGGGIGGGTTERYYSDAAVILRDGEDPITAKVFKTLQPIIQADITFTDAFSTRRVSNPRLIRYYLLALEHLLSSTSRPFAVSSAEAEQYSLYRILPRRADPAGWPEFDPLEIGQWSMRLGNAVLLGPEDPIPETEDYAEIRETLSKSRLTWTRNVAEFQTWSPETIGSRQKEWAPLAAEIWQRLPGHVEQSSS
jgi:hypothetical protein